MFRKTDLKNLNYKFNDKYYSVPTFGRIFKLIDFGRSIYKFNGRLICSDSYHQKGDAATQYNFGPYFNKKKPHLAPNKSFDLCRLACSLYDYFIEDISSEQETDPIAELIRKWCTDDKGRNILYKNNRQERYPDFKLYKMIVRTVSKHVPAEQVDSTVFHRFLTTRKVIGKKHKIIDVDKLPDYAVRRD